MKQASIVYVGIVWTTALLVGASESYRILFMLPVPAKSHFSTAASLADELVRRGHEVTVVTSISVEKPMYREIVIDLKPFLNQHFFDLDPADMRPRLLYAAFFWRMMSDLMDALLSSEELQALMRSNDTYDAIVGDFSFYQSCLTVFGHKFKAPLIDFSMIPARTFTASYTGNPHPFSFVPDVLPFTDRMDFGQRLYGTAFGIAQLLTAYLYGLPKQEAIARKHFKYPGVERRPSLRELHRSTSIVFVNAHFSVDYPRPYSPNVIEVGGLAIRPVGKLPEDLQRYMDEAKEGVIFISFGSLVNTSTISEEKLHAVVTAMKRLNHKFVIKWHDPAPFQDLENVKALKWVPQQEILAHPNIRLFVTHGGYNSLMEVLYAGVPVLGVPFLGDQFRNVRLYESKGVGRALDYDAMTGDELYRSIVSILQTPSFRENAKKQSRITRDRPEKAMERAVYWTEYVIRHNGAHHLKPSAVYQPYYQYLLLDVILISLVLIFAFPFLICKFVRRAFVISHSKIKITRPESSKRKKNE